LVGFFSYPKTIPKDNRLCGRVVKASVLNFCTRSSVRVAFPACLRGAAPPLPESPPPLFDETQVRNDKVRGSSPRVSFQIARLAQW